MTSSPDAGSDPAPPPRDLMAPGTEPTDEELAAVMRAAREDAVRLEAVSDAWVADRLAEATAFARAHRRRRGPGPNAGR